MARRARDAAAALVLVSAVCAGCASTARSTFSARFVTPGTPTVDLGGPAPHAPPPLARSRPTRGPRFVTRESAGLATLEAISPLLRERLAALAAAPSVDGYLAVASAYRRHGVYDRAFDYLTDGLARYPRQAALHDAVARMWRDWGLPDRALRHAYLAARYAPASAETHNTLGTVLWALFAREAAVGAFARAVALDAGAAYAVHNLCHAAAALGQAPPPACTAPHPADRAQTGPPP